MSTPLHETQTIVFLKAPSPGLVKTRLAAAIGTHGAATAYRNLISHLIDKIAALKTVELRFAPDDAGPAITRWLQPGWTSRPQGGGGLGKRLLTAFESSRLQGYAKTIIIGSDCPYLDGDDLLEAASRLDEHDVVLGPATDGGYWLIGLREPQPGLFTDISWSTDVVLKQTLERTEELGLRFHLLRTLSDIDTLEDWNAYLAGPDAAASRPTRPWSC